VSLPATFHYRFPNAERIVSARVDPGELVPHIQPFYGAYRCASGAGKSTLALGLSLAGWQPLADDALLIDPEDGGVRPFDRSIRVHEASLRALEVQAERVPGARLCEPYLWLAPRPDPDRPACHPDAVVFLKKGAETALAPLSAGVTLRELLAARLSDRPHRDFDCLAGLAARVPGYHLSIASFTAALAELVRL
jgi:hypothetical protein